MPGPRYITGMNIFSEIKLALEAKKLYGLTKEAIMKNWRTTLMGLALGVLMGAKSYAAQHGITLEGFLEFLIPALMGTLAKDAHNTEGK